MYVHHMFIEKVFPWPPFRGHTQDFSQGGVLFPLRRGKLLVLPSPQRKKICLPNIYRGGGNILHSWKARGALPPPLASPLVHHFPSHPSQTPLLKLFTLCWYWYVLVSAMRSSLGRRGHYPIGPLPLYAISHPTPFPSKPPENIALIRPVWGLIYTGLVPESQGGGGGGRNMP